MKTKHLFTLIRTLILLLIITTGCKKNNTENPEDNCSQTTFQVTLDETEFKVVDLCEDNDGNIILLGHNQTQNKILKLNSLGEMVWSKIVENTSNPKEVVTQSDNSIIVLFATDPVKTDCDVLYDHGWVQNAEDFGEFCLATYELGLTLCYTYLGEMELIMFDSTGNKLWSKDFPEIYTDGNSLMHSGENIVLLTAELSGKQPEYTFNNQGEFTDTINYPYTRNSINVYNISKEGEIIWKSSFGEIKNLPGLDEFFPNVSIVEVEDGFIIKTYNEILTIDNYGTMITRNKVIPDYCDNQTYLITSIDQQNYLLSGFYKIMNGFIIEEGVPYTEMRNLNNETIWRKEMLMNIVDGNQDGFITKGQSGINFHNNSGDYKFSISLYNSTCAKLSYFGGVIIAEFNDSKTIITKTDANGVF